MSCGFSKGMLSLHVEGDLPEAAARITAKHLETCEDCRRFLDQLRVRQSLLKSLRRHTVSPSECRDVRREVMSIINERRDTPGWPLRLERAFMLGFRQRSYALAAFALVGIVSVSVLAQMRHAIPGTAHSAAAFQGQDTLLRPEGYRDWILVGRAGSSGSGVDHGASTATYTQSHNVYIDPLGYQQYVKTGTFPEGTVIVWESVHGRPPRKDHPHKESSVLLASVKDSTRFNGSWGFFDFTGLEGTVMSETHALPESSGCRACHRQDAETDHVFTQFYPVLRSAPHGAQLAVARGRAT